METTGDYWGLLDTTGDYRTLQQISGDYWLLEINGDCPRLKKFTEGYWTLLEITRDMCNWWLLELNGTLLLEAHSLLLCLLRQVEIGTGYQNYQYQYQYTGDYQRLLEITGNYCRLLEITGDYWGLLETTNVTGDYWDYVIFIFPYKLHTILSFASYHCVGWIWSNYLLQGVQVIGSNTFLHSIFWHRPNVP